MLIAITLSSILLITVLIRFANKFLPLEICPICAGVSGTWIWLLAALFAGYPVKTDIPALLMGGSVVGIAYQMEKRLKPGQSGLLWKVFFIVPGFLSAYSLLSERWTLLFVSVVIISIILLFFFSLSSANNKRASELEKKMKDCC